MMGDSDAGYMYCGKGVQRTWPERLGHAAKNGPLGGGYCLTGSWVP